MVLGKKQTIKVRMFIELMGWPKEALNESLKKIVETLKDKWKVLKEDYSEPEKIGEKSFSSYVELEAEVPNVQQLFGVVLAYGPTVVEIIEPSEVYVSATDMQDILADISSKVNILDRDVKVLSMRFKKATELIEKLKNGSETEKEAQNDEENKTSKFTIKK